MPFVTYSETKAKTEGEVKGLRAGINVGLNIRFKEAAAPVKAEIAAIDDPALLEAILDRLETATSLEDVRAVYHTQQS